MDAWTPGGVTLSYAGTALVGVSCRFAAVGAGGDEHAGAGAILSILHPGADPFELAGRAVGRYDACLAR